MDIYISICIIAVIYLVLCYIVLSLNYIYQVFTIGDHYAHLTGIHLCASQNLLA
jgi:hypothetical protein